jgi:hypothetical protein
MRNVLLIVVFFIVGCSSKIKRLELEPYVKLSVPSISINTPSSLPKNRWITYGDTLYDSGNVIQLFRQIPNMMSEDVRITVTTVPAGEQGMSNLLNKKHDLEKSLQDPPSEWAKKNLAEGGVRYSMWYVDHISGLKCSTNVESSDVALGVGNKKYGTYCAYYDINGGRKEIDISYRYTYTHSGTEFDGDTQSNSATPQAMQQQFKQDIKAIFDSLVIHDMDKDRMSKEGLLHDRKYEILEW